MDKIKMNKKIKQLKEENKQLRIDRANKTLNSLINSIEKKEIYIEDLGKENLKRLLKII